MKLLLILGDPSLSGLQDTLISNWVGPAFLLTIGVLSVPFLVKRQFREFAGFIGIATLVALLVYNADGLFGKDKLFYNIAQSFTNALNGGSTPPPASGGASGAGGMIEILKAFWK